MTARLPVVGSDDGDWGVILNSFLEISHNNDGTLQTNAITDAGGYIKPSTGIPSSDLSSSVQSSLTAANSAVQIGGDIGGSTNAPVVVKINGVSLSGQASSGQSLVATSSTAAAWQTVEGPWIVDFCLLRFPDATVGTWAIGVNTAYYFNGRVLNTSEQQNDSADWIIPSLDAGTWTFDINCAQSAVAAIITLKLDTGNGFTTLGTIDTYASSTTFGWLSLPGIVISQKINKPTLRLLAATKNPASSSYSIAVSAGMARRTS